MQVMLGTSGQASDYANPVMGGAQFVGQSGDPGGGRYVVLRLLVKHQTICDCSFETNGCPVAHLAVGGLATFLKDRRIDQASRLDPSDLLVLIGGLPEGKGYYADMAVEALKDALSKIPGSLDYA